MSDGMRDPRQIVRFRASIVGLAPPQRVLDRFDELVRFTSDCATEYQLEGLLKEAARLENWTKPWETGDHRLTFRAGNIDRQHPEFHDDIGGENSPAIEQAYRRGVSHGFARARRMIGADFCQSDEVKELETRIYRWRTASMHSRNAISWGAFEEPDYPCVIRETGRRSGISLKLRYAVFQRDGQRCVICGASAREGALLEVDHVLPVAKGGPDEMDNLQVLCFDCNRGKGVD